MLLSKQAPPLKDKLHTDHCLSQLSSRQQSWKKHKEERTQGLPCRKKRVRAERPPRQEAHPDRVLIPSVCLNISFRKDRQDGLLGCVELLHAAIAVVAEGHYKLFHALRWRSESVWCRAKPVGRARKACTGGPNQTKAQTSNLLHA